MPDSLQLFPPPQTCRLTGGSCRLPESCRDLSGFPPPIQSFAHHLCVGGERTELVLDRDGAVDAPEAYRLLIQPGKVTVSAGSDRGIWLGLQSLKQLCQRHTEIPCAEVADAPAFPERGFMLDISRNKVPTMASLKELVDLLALLKFNQLQLYTEHAFAYSGHALVWGDASPLTGGEIRELDMYCLDRYIELVPNQNSFGHMERWLRWKEYHHLAESPDGWHATPTLAKDSGTVLRPDEASLDFMDGLFGELLPLFSSGRFNIGCDETWELGLGWSKPLADRIGKHEVYLRHLLGLMERVRHHGRTPLFWADILLNEPASIERLPQDGIPIIWGYDPEHPYHAQCPMVAAAGLPFYVAPGTATWKTLTGNPHAALANARNAARNGRASGAQGLLLTNWGDEGHHQPWILSLPGLAAGAAEAWHPGSSQIEGISAFLDVCLFGDLSGSVSKALWTAGLVDPADSRRPVNDSTATRLFNILLAPHSKVPLLTDGTVKGLLMEFQETLSAASSLLSRASGKVTASRGSDFVEELHWCLSAAEIALERALCISAVPGQKPIRLRPAMQELIGQFEFIWLKRNRPGGLHDSSSRLRRVLGELGPAPANTDYYNPSGKD